MTDDELLAELQRLSAQFEEFNRQQAANLRRLQHTIDVVAAAPTAPPRDSGPPRSYRDAVRTASTRSPVSAWASNASASPISSDGISNGGSSSPPAPAPAVVREDLQLVIRSTEPAQVDPLRRKEMEIVNRANRAIKDHHDDLGRPGAPIRVSAGLVLPSGDVLLRGDAVADVRGLISLANAAAPGDGWCAVFGRHAYIKRETYPVLMHGVPVTEFDPKDEASKAKLQAQNVRRLPPDAVITRMGWLLPERKLAQADTAKMVIEFDDPEVANRAIRLGLALQGRDRNCFLYDSSHRLQQCFNCQGYGHIARNCRRPAACLTARALTAPRIAPTPATGASPSAQHARNRRSLPTDTPPITASARSASNNSKSSGPILQVDPLSSTSSST